MQGRVGVGWVRRVRAGLPWAGGHDEWLAPAHLWVGHVRVGKVGQPAVGGSPPCPTYRSLPYPHMCGGGRVG